MCVMRACTEIYLPVNTRVQIFDEELSAMAAWKCVGVVPMGSMDQTQVKIFVPELMMSVAEMLIFCFQFKFYSHNLRRNTKSKQVFT